MQHRRYDPNDIPSVRTRHGKTKSELRHHCINLINLNISAFVLWIHVSCSLYIVKRLDIGLVGAADARGALKNLVVVVLVGMGVRNFSRLLLQEVGVREGGEGGRLVDDGRIVDGLVDTDGVVDGGGLDGLALDDGLD